MLIQLGWMLVFFSFLVSYAGTGWGWLPHVLLGAGAAVFAANLVAELLSDDAAADPVTAGAVGAVALVLGILGIDVAARAGRRRR